MPALPIIALAGLSAYQVGSQIKQGNDAKKAAAKASADATKQQDALMAEQTKIDTQTKVNDVRSRQAADLQRRRAAAAGGRSSTLLTGGYGINEPAPTQRKSLLGV